MLPPGIHSVVSMFKSKKCGGEGKYQFLKHFAKDTKLKVIVLVVLAYTHNCQ